LDPTLHHRWGTRHQPTTLLAPGYLGWVSEQNAVSHSAEGPLCPTSPGVLPGA